MTNTKQKQPKKAPASETPVVVPGHAEKATPEQTAANVRSAAHAVTSKRLAQQEAANQLADRFESLHKQTYRDGNGVIRCVDKMLPSIEEMRQLTSRKGDREFKELRRLTKRADGRQYFDKYPMVPEFTTWLSNLADEFGLSLRTLQRKLAEFRGESADAPNPNPNPNPNRSSAAYKAPTRREFVPYVLLAEQVNTLIDEYSNPTTGDVPAAMEGLKKLAISEDRIGKALTNTATLETAEELVAPVIASAAAYIRALEDALYENTPERLARVERYKAEWRILRHDAKLKPLYDAVRAFTEEPEAVTVTVEPSAQPQPEPQPNPLDVMVEVNNEYMRTSSEASADGTPIGGEVQIPEFAPSQEATR